MESAINETFCDVNKRLFGHNLISDNHNNDKIKSHNIEFKYPAISEDKMTEYLLYIHAWNGLSSSAKVPATYRNYENKARNWLNGRRSKTYSNSLYVDMIGSALNV